MTPFLSREITILLWRVQVRKWLVIFIPTLVFSILISTSAFTIRDRDYGAYIIWVFSFLAIVVGVSFLLLAYVLIRATQLRLRTFVVFALIVSAAAFITNSFIFRHMVFPPFTNRTIILLWIVFVTLGLSLVKNQLPNGFTILAQPILFFGIILCLGFAIVLIPAMAFGWMLIPVFGLGFLAYSPLVAGAAFLLVYLQSNRELKNTNRKLGIALTQIVLAVTLVYSVWYGIEWHRNISQIQKQSAAVMGHNRIDADLPAWLRIGQNIRANHVTEMLLQPSNDQRSVAFSTGKLFDPLAYIVSLFHKTNEIEASQKEDLLKLLFNYSHTHLERLWSGEGLVTSTLDTNVQVFPGGRVAYAEIILSVYNEQTFGEQEAIYTLDLPEGAVCTKLSLWVGNEERKARLTFASKARTAYKTIVGVERRDPSYIEWLDSNRIRLRIFPVTGNNYRTVKFGIITPMINAGGFLRFQSPKFSGPDSTGLQQKIQVDIYGAVNSEPTSKDVKLKEKIVSDGEVRQWLATAKDEAWSFAVPTQPLATNFFANEKHFEIHDVKLRQETYHPGAIALALNGSLSKREWKELIFKIRTTRPDLPLYLLASEWFHSSSNEKIVQWIDQVELPTYNLFPTYLNDMIDPKGDDREILFVTAGEAISAQLGETKGSDFYRKTKRYLANRENQLRIVTVNGKQSSYVRSLVGFDMATIVGSSASEIIQILKDHQIQTVRHTRQETPMKGSGLSIDFTSVKHEGNEKKSPAPMYSDLILRLGIYNQIMHSLGQRYFDGDLENADLVGLAAEGAIVSPVSTLIVLETDADYKRFGIDAATHGMGQSSLKKPGMLGSVPEPAEWIFILLLLLFISWRMRNRSRVTRSA